MQRILALSIQLCRLGQPLCRLFLLLLPSTPSLPIRERCCRQLRRRSDRSVVAELGIRSDAQFCKVKSKSGKGRANRIWSCVAERSHLLHTFPSSPVTPSAFSASCRSLASLSTFCPCTTFCLRIAATSRQCFRRSWYSASDICSTSLSANDDDDLSSSDDA